MISFTPTLRTIWRILHTRYPAFLFGLPLRGAEVPVFTYHDVSAAELTRDLEFLELNRYRTLTLDEFVQRDGTAIGEREVLLTFDDARASTSRVALPILREFGAHAALFVPTHWIRDARHPAPWTGTLFMSWEDVRQCADSGVFSIGSHAHRHALVHRSRRLVGFTTPDTLAHHDIYDWPMRNAGGREELGPPPLGTPVYEATPLLSARHCYIENAELTQLCREYVEQREGQHFFRHPGACAELRRFHDGHRDRRRGQLMRHRQLTALVASEFELSCAAFQRHLGFVPRCFAFPWMLGSALALDWARRTGMRAVFGCALDFRHASRAAAGVRAFGRYKADWLRLLPGEKRNSLRNTFGRKLAAFASHRHLAH